MKRRMNNIFKPDGKAFVLAMDHGNGLPVLPAMNKTGEIIEKAVEGGIDALLTTYGISSTFQKQIGNIGLILRGDGGTTMMGSHDVPMETIYTAKSAVRVGADSMLVMGFPGATFEKETLMGLTKLINEAVEYNLPIGAEMLPRGFEFNKFDDARTAENLAYACRVGCELGADYIKTDYPGKEGFKAMVEGCYKPILVLGGGATKAERDLLQMVKDSLDCGGKGVIMGRNIWRHPKVKKICKAIASVIHDDATVEQAMKHLI